MPRLLTKIGQMKCLHDARAGGVYNCKACFPSHAILGVSWQNPPASTEDESARHMPRGIESIVALSGYVAESHHAHAYGHRDATVATNHWV